MKAKSRLLSLLLLFAPGPALASGEGEETEAHSSVHRSPHTEDSRFILGLKAVQLSEFPPEGESLFGGGVGAFGETTLVHGWLELELSASLARVSGGEESAWVLPFDALLKKPFHVGMFCPYLAIGPTVTFSFIDEHEGVETLVGGAAVLGAYIWFNDQVGLDVEVDYALVSNDGVQHELTFAVGPTLRL